MTAQIPIEPGLATPALKPRVRLLGGEIDAVTPAEVLAFIEACVAARRPGVIANHNLHSLYLIRRHEEMAAFYRRADLIQADSYPLIAWGRLLGKPLSGSHRATYLDWREDFWALAQLRGWRVFYLGGALGVAAGGAAAVQARWSGAAIAARDGYFVMDDPAQAQAVIEAITEAKPDVLLVGMGMPRQETWILRNLDRLPPCVVLPVGAAFDYEAGIVPTPPRWTGPLGVEWLFRFCAEPGRLFTRYFIEPWSLIGPALADLRARSAQSSP